ncbi:MAG: metallophosphoesterase [Candidatus Marsarchaeota archaeon]|jgi:putative SbcD/Mre11-related phosphoesterase|nr:metallophosphoesterase [Candidatus Marsarchaeota archaeon]
MIGIPSLIKNEPALFVKDRKMLVIGDLHLGKELAMKTSGIHLGNVPEVISRRILDLKNRKKATSIAFLGDVKESISYPTNEEMAALRTLFRKVSDTKVVVAKGNHDAYLEDFTKRFGLDVNIKKEFIFEDFALMHGNFIPSKEALEKRHIIIAHGHAAVNTGIGDEKVWIFAKPGKAAVKRNSKLIIAPAFNDLITGSRINANLKKFIPLFNKDVFDFYNAEVYGLDKKRIGIIGDLI